MKQRTFTIALLTVLVFGLIIRLLPTRGNNFYFTMDQADEAVRAREIWYRHQIPLTGQGTSLPGIYHGPFWIWYISFWYAIFRGHPFGALFSLIVIKLALTAFIIRSIAQRISPQLALLIGASLQVFWPFYDASRYAFSPFPLVSIGFATLLFLTQAVTQDPRKYILAAIPIGSIIHTELASFPPFFALFLLTGLWGLYKKQLTIAVISLAAVVLFIFFLPHFITEVARGFPQVWALVNHLSSPENVFTTPNQQTINAVFLALIGKSLLSPFHLRGIGVILVGIFFLVTLWHVRMKATPQKGSRFASAYSTLTLVLLLFSWLWFSISRGWNPWHTVYIPPLIFVAILISIWYLPKPIIRAAYLIILTSQVLSFGINYREYFRPSEDASILHNELSTIDWIYQKAQEEGFYVYTYLPSVYDYPYQYLFWWYGRKTYGYVPCEYSTYPNTPSLFIPGLPHYQSPKKPCTNKRFLIIEPDKNTANQDRWLSGVQSDTKLIDQATVGAIMIEEREIPILPEL